RLPSGGSPKAERSADEVKARCTLKWSWTVGHLLSSTSNSGRPTRCSKRQDWQVGHPIESSISVRRVMTLTPSGVTDRRERLRGSDHASRRRYGRTRASAASLSSSRPGGGEQDPKDVLVAIRSDDNG